MYKAQCIGTIQRICKISEIIIMIVSFIDTILCYSYCFCLFYEGKVWAVFCITFKSLLEMTVNKKTENKSLLEEVSMSQCPLQTNIYLNSLKENFSMIKIWPKAVCFT